MITTKLAKLEARQHQVLPPLQGHHQQNRYHKPSSWTTDGKPVCYNCGYSGHISKDCRAPRRSSMGQTSRNQSHSKYHPTKEYCGSCGTLYCVSSPGLSPIPPTKPICTPAYAASMTSCSLSSVPSPQFYQFN